MSQTAADVRTIHLDDYVPLLGAEIEELRALAGTASGALVSDGQFHRDGRRRR